MNDPLFPCAPDTNISAHSLKKQLENIQPDKAVGTVNWYDPNWRAQRNCLGSGPCSRLDIATVIRSRHVAQNLLKDAEITTLYKIGQRSDPKTRPVSL